MQLTGHISRGRIVYDSVMRLLSSCSPVLMHTGEYFRRAINMKVHTACDKCEKDYVQRTSYLFKEREMCFYRQIKTSLFASIFSEHLLR